VSRVHEGKSSRSEKSPRIRSGQFGTPRNTKSVQEVSKQLDVSPPAGGHYGKTDIRYWHEAVFQPEYTRKGVARRVSEWAAKIQHVGRRATFPLGTPNRAAAAARAREIFLSLRSIGWEGTLTKFKPNVLLSKTTVATVGEFLTDVRANASARRKTIEDYSRAFRTIVSAIADIDGGRSKYDYRTGGRQVWLNKVHNIDLKVCGAASSDHSCVFHNYWQRTLA